MRTDDIIKLIEEEFGDIINESKKGGIEINWSGTSIKALIKKNIDLNKK